MPFTSTIGIVKGSVFEPLGEEGVQTAELLAAEVAKEIDMLTDHLKGGVDAENGCGGRCGCAEGSRCAEGTKGSC